MPFKPMKKVVHEGRVWCSVNDGAHYLGTNSNKIRALMGAGAVACTQLRKNGAIYVAVEDLVKVKYPEKSHS